MLQQQYRRLKPIDLSGIKKHKRKTRDYRNLKIKIIINLKSKSQTKDFKRRKYLYKFYKK